MNDSLQKDTNRGNPIDIPNAQNTSSPIINADKGNSLPKNTEELKSELKKCMETKDLKFFTEILMKCGNLIKNDLLKFLLQNFIEYYKKGEIYYYTFLNCLLEFIEDPNIILDIKDNKISILMILCEFSESKMVLSLCNKKINLNVNYEDSFGRNALFYLKGGKEDRKIIELLVQKNIKIDHKDKEGNTALHYQINNETKEIVYNLIDIGNANFMIKNNENKSSLELITLKWISKKNLDKELKANIFNFREINKLIQLIKKKLSIKSLEDNSPKIEKLNLSVQSSYSHNIFKIPSLSFKKNISETKKKNIEKENIKNNIYLTIKKNPALIINTTKFENRKNNISFSQKIERYKLINRNKRIFLNFLKNSENYLIEKAKIIKATLEEKKKELEKKKRELNYTKLNFDIIMNNLDKKLSDEYTKIDYIKYNIKNLIKTMNHDNCKNLIEITNDIKLVSKFQISRKIQNIDYTYIYKQLTIDLNDYFVYISTKNKQLNNTIKEIYLILINCVKKCLGKGYKVIIYGSRATGICLPWSDIDFVIKAPNNINNYYPSLDILYNYLLNNASFIEDIKYIKTTLIPIIKIKTTEEYKNLGLDISMEMYSHHGQECVNYIIQKNLEYKPLGPMAIALKTIFYKAKLNDPYRGGLSSYGLILLIIYFLKIKQNKGEEISLNNIGKLFFELLFFYKNKKNINNPIIINDNFQITPFFKIINPEKTLVIVDPLNTSNNVAKNVRQLNKILCAFAISAASLFESCECGCHYQHDLSIIEEKCNHNLLNNIFKAIERENYD